MFRHTYPSNEHKRIIVSKRSSLTPYSQIEAAPNQYRRSNLPAHRKSRHPIPSHRVDVVWCRPALQHLWRDLLDVAHPVHSSPRVAGKEMEASPEQRRRRVCECSRKFGGTGGPLHSSTMRRLQSCDAVKVQSLPSNSNNQALLVNDERRSNHPPSFRQRKSRELEPSDELDRPVRYRQGFIDPEVARRSPKRPRRSGRHGI